MKELNLSWEEFVARHSLRTVEPRVDLNKGHALMKAPFAPKEWRFAIRFWTKLSLLALPIGIVLFFFVSWWIPVLVIVLALLSTSSIRKTAAGAVVETSLKSEEFYQHALLSGTMRVYDCRLN